MDAAPRAGTVAPPVGAGARLRRTLAVAGIVARHGLIHASRRPGPAPAARRARRLRHLLEDLGATAVKLGQIASTRPDVLGPEYLAELARLQDAAPAEDPAAIRAVITAELGRPPEAVFASFDPEPLAAASIGQAHAAVHRDGTPVVVKVRRPGVVAQVAVDLDVLDRVARAAARVSRAARTHDLVGLARQFADTLQAELDYEIEAANARRIATAFADRADLRIPRVFADASTRRVITLERCTGIKPDDLPALDAAGVDRRALAARCADVMLTMILEHGFFHADPHAGNFFVQPDGTIALIDFGMVGTLDPPRRVALIGVLTAVAAGDADRLADAALVLGMAAGAVDRDALMADLGALVAVHLDRPLGDLRVGDLLLDVMGTMRRNHLRLPVDLALLAKTFVMSEGLAARLDPEFRMAPAVLAHLAAPLPDPPPDPVPPT